MLLRLAPLPAYVPSFVSEKEHYKASAELVERAISQMDIQVSPYKYINFQRLDLMDEDIDFYGVLIFATPDILSGLVSWAYFDNASQDAVAVPWGSGCSATIRAVIRENELMGRQSGRSSGRTSLWADSVSSASSTRLCVRE